MPPPPLPHRYEGESDDNLQPRRRKPSSGVPAWVWVLVGVGTFGMLSCGGVILLAVIGQRTVEREAAKTGHVPVKVSNAKYLSRTAASWERQLADRDGQLQADARQALVALYDDGGCERLINATIDGNWMCARAIEAKDVQRYASTLLPLMERWLDSGDPPMGAVAVGWAEKIGPQAASLAGLIEARRNTFQDNDTITFHNRALSAIRAKR